MNIRSTTLKLLICTFLLSAGTALFGQTTYTWTGAADGTNIAAPGNWTTNGVNPAITLPSGTFQDTAEWNGVAPGNLVIDNEAAGLPGTGFGTSGINLVLGASQAGSVQILSPVASSANLAIFSITINSGAGNFMLGDGTANLLQAVDRPAGAAHTWANNSTSTGIIGASVRWVAGGGSANTIDFTGTGNWIVTNYLRDDNGAGPRTIQNDSTGTITWVANPVQRGNSPTGPINIDTGTIILKSPGLIPFENPGTVPAGNNTIVNNALLEYDAGVGSAVDNQQRVISSIGNIQVNSGTLELSGQSTYTGSNILTGGELVANAADNATNSGPLGVSNIISFVGGTLGFGANNTFDYSSRFETNPNEQYSIDTAGQQVTFSTGLASSGGTFTKLGSGTLTLTGTSSYSGLTTVSAGKLVFQGSKTGSASITVQDGAALGVFTTGAQVTPGTLTVGSSSGATLEFNSVSSTTTPPIGANTLSSAGTITININSGTLTPGQSYPLLIWTNGSAPTVALGILNGFIGNLSFAGNELVLNITATAYKWTGNNNNSWDTTTPNNWQQNGGPVIFGANGVGPAFFDDTAASNTSITINSPVTATLVTFAGVNSNYSIAASGANNIGGSTAVIQGGTSTTTLSGGANTYTGVTTISAGTLSVGTLANGGSASDIGAAANTAGNLVLNGGTLQYTNGGAVSVDRLFTVGTSGGTIDASGSGALALTNTGSIGLSGSGARVLTLTGSDQNGETLAAVLGDNVGASSLIKNASNTWILTGNNTFSGGITINSGVLQVGVGAGTGAIGSGNVVDDGALVFNRTNSLTVNGTISGSGVLTNNGTGTLILSANNSYLGNTFNGTGTLQIGNGGSTGSLQISGSITNNGTLTFNTTGSYTLNGNIGGTGQVIQKGSGLLILQGTEANNGLTIASGGKLEIFKGNQGAYAAGGGITNNGTLFMVRQDNNVAGITNPISGTGFVIEDVNNGNSGDVTLVGTNTYTGFTFICGGSIILGDGVTAGAGALALTTNSVVFTNSILTANDTFRALKFNRPDNFTFSNNILGKTGAGVFSGNAGQVVQNGTNTVTLVGTNTYIGGTVASNGVLIIGNGGARNSMGSGLVDSETLVVLSMGGSLTTGGTLGGTGTIVQQGPGTVIDTATNNTINNLVVSNGTLSLLSAGTNLTNFAGTLGAGGLNSVGVMTVISNMTMAGGTVSMALNKSLAVSNSFVLLTNIVINTNVIPATTNGFAGTLTYTGGTLSLSNLGPALVAGDRFVLFSQPVTGGASMPIVLSGYTFNNNLAVDGSITVVTVPPSVPPTFKKITLSGTNVIITATNNTGPGGTYHLLSTNNIAAPLTNWPVISAGSFDANGNLALTNAVGTSPQFFILQVP